MKKAPKYVFQSSPFSFRRRVNFDKPKEEMSEEELEFHYFKLHDYDSNNKLDGTEITKAITHFHGKLLLK